MKKTYMTPSLKVANIVLPSIMAGSLTEGGNPVGEDEITTPEGIAAKKSSIFDM